MIEYQYYGTEVYKDIIRSAIDGHINWCSGLIRVSTDAPDQNVFISKQWNIAQHFINHFEKVTSPL